MTNEQDGFIQDHLRINLSKQCGTASNAELTKDKQDHTGTFNIIVNAPI